MPLLDSELTITGLGTLLAMPLVIPTYQRPYRWSDQSCITLAEDIYLAYQQSQQFYRLGSVILHKDYAKNHYNIVDGQQRLTTIAILLYLLEYHDSTLLQQNYKQDSKPALIHNFRKLNKWLDRRLMTQGRLAYKEYLLKHCEVVQVVTDKEQEAFQFFDSQNSRGKSLAAHDLLKAYHLREMDQIEEAVKKELIRQWEDIDNPSDSSADHIYLNDFFKHYLYPCLQWHKYQEGIKFNKQKIEVFKGINSKASGYNYARFYKQYTDESQFLLTSPFFSGKRFFDYILHYHHLLKVLQEKISSNTSLKLPSSGIGNIYAKRLFTCSALFFADRFGLEYLNDNDEVLEQLYVWSYALRLERQSLKLDAINLYALAKLQNSSNSMNIFYRISQMQHPDEIHHLTLNTPKMINDRQKEVYKKICKINGAPPK